MPEDKRLEEAMGIFAPSQMGKHHSFRQQLILDEIRKVAGENGLYKELLAKLSTPPPPHSPTEGPIAGEGTNQLLQ